MDNHSLTTMRDRTEMRLDTSSTVILSRYSQAEDDARCVGYRERNGRYSGSANEVTIAAAVADGKAMKAAVGKAPKRRDRFSGSPTEDAALRLIEDGDFASRWLNDVQNATRELERLGNQALRHWPDQLKPGDVFAGIKVGARSNTVEVCDHCREPIPPGLLPNNRPTVIRVNGKPLHRNTCYFQMRRANSANTP